MSDFISRSQLLKEIETWGGCVEELHEYIQNMPTAYDIDKVVSKLKQQAEQYRHRAFEAEKKGLSVFAHKYYGKQCSYEHAIEIVKQGGVYDDVCEWKLDGVYIFSPHTKIFNCVIDDKYRYNYCPVCGKKIKIVGE